MNNPSYQKRGGLPSYMKTEECRRRLEDWTLQQYLPSFIREGYDDPSDWLNFTDTQLDRIGMRLQGHRDRFFNAINAEKNKRPPWHWYQVVAEDGFVIVRETKDIDSKELCRIKTGKIVKIAEVDGKKAHIEYPETMRGWVSIEHQTGEPLLQCLSDRELYGIELTIIGAKNLPAMDWGFSDGKLADPYIVFKFKGDGKEFRTNTEKGNQNPCWYGQYEFQYEEKNEIEDIVFEVWDEDPLKPDDLIGFATLKLRANEHEWRQLWDCCELKESGGIKKTLIIKENRDATGKGRGDLFCEVKLLTLGKLGFPERSRKVKIDAMPMVLDTRVAEPEQRIRALRSFGESCVSPSRKRRLTQLFEIVNASCIANQIRDDQDPRVSAEACDTVERIVRTHQYELLEVMDEITDALFSCVNVEATSRDARQALEAVVDHIGDETVVKVYACLGGMSPDQFKLRLNDIRIALADGHGVRAQDVALFSRLGTKPPSRILQSRRFADVVDRGVCIEYAIRTGSRASAQRLVDDINSRKFLGRLERFIAERFDEVTVGYVKSELEDLLLRKLAEGANSKYVSVKRCVYDVLTRLLEKEAISTRSINRRDPYWEKLEPIIEKGVHDNNRDVAAAAKASLEALKRKNIELANRIERHVPLYEQGDRVEAKWRDGVYYPATVEAVSRDNRVKVRYIKDGIVHLCDPNEVRPYRAERANDSSCIDNLRQELQGLREQRDDLYQGRWGGKDGIVRAMITGRGGEMDKASSGLRAPPRPKYTSDYQQTPGGGGCGTTPGYGPTPGQGTGCTPGAAPYRSAGQVVAQSIFGDFGWEMIDRQAPKYYQGTGTPGATPGGQQVMDAEEMILPADFFLENMRRMEFTPGNRRDKVSWYPEFKQPIPAIGIEEGDRVEKIGPYDQFGRYPPYAQIDSVDIYGKSEKDVRRVVKRITKEQRSPQITITVRRSPPKMDCLSKFLERVSLNTIFDSVERRRGERRLPREQARFMLAQFRQCSKNAVEKDDPAISFIEGRTEREIRALLKDLPVYVYPILQGVKTTSDNFWVEPLHPAEDERGDDEKELEANCQMWSVDFETLFRKYQEKGLVDTARFKRAIEDVGLPVAEDEILDAFNKYVSRADAGENALDAVEFAYAASDLRNSAVFLQLDKDQNDKIDEDEFRRGMRFIGSSFTDKRLEELFNQFDKDTSGLLSKEHFFEAADTVAFREMIAPGEKKKSREAEKVELRILKKEPFVQSDSWIYRRDGDDYENFERAPDPKDLDEWAPGDVVDWIQYGRWTQEFDSKVSRTDAEKVAVDGRNFVQLDDSDLEQMGICSFSTRLKIKHAIRAAVNQGNVATPGGWLR